jgi:hypothetical protein
MNYSTSFDSHDFVKQLINKKFIPEQAEAIVGLFMEIKTRDHKSLVKKTDLYRELVMIKHELHNIELRMTIKFGCMISAALGVVKFWM